MNAKPYVLSHHPKLYERLIDLYPSSYLAKHREELLQNFEDLERDIGSKKMFWAFIVGDFLKSLTHEYMQYIKHHRWIQVALVIAILLVGLGVQQVLYLQKAHSTFDNYAAFRGCAQITSRTDTQGTCTTNTGQTVTIVKFDDRWFLQGDLPVCMINIGSFCLADQP